MTFLLPASDEFLEFWRERRLCTVTTVRADGTPHVVPMGVALDPEAGRAWAITSGSSQKARNIAAAGPDGAPIAVCQVEGARWSTIEGRVTASDEPLLVAEAERRYAERYRTPRENVLRVGLRIEITRVLGNVR